MGEKEFLATLTELLDKKIDVIVTEKIPAVLEEALEYSLLPKLNIILDAKLEARFAEQDAKFEARFAQIDDRFAQIEARFAQIDDRFAQIEARLAQIDDRFAQIDDRFVQIEARFAQIDDRFAQIEARFAQIDDRFVQIDDRFAQIDDKFEFYNAKLEASFSRLESEIFKLQDAVKDINLRLDNEIMPNIRLLSENYVPAAKRYEAASDEIIAIRSDVDLLKIVVSQHSKRLEQMA